MEAAHLSADDAGRALLGRNRRILEMSTIATTKRCFREALMEALEDTARYRGPTLAMRILAWVLSERSRTGASIACCDSCDPAARDVICAGGLPADVAAAASQWD